MKKTLSCLTAFVLAVVMLIGTASAAAEGARSSLYLDAYRAWLTPKSGAKINVTIDVQAVDYMDSVGALEVIIYESSDGGSSWENVRTYASALNPDLLAHDTYLYYDTPISHQGTAGYKYYAVVTVYAKDSTGSDSKENQTYTVTAFS